MLFSYTLFLSALGPIAAVVPQQGFSGSNGTRFAWRVQQSPRNVPDNISPDKTGFRPLLFQALLSGNFTPPSRFFRYTALPDAYPFFKNTFSTVVLCISATLSPPILLHIARFTHVLSSAIAASLRFFSSSFACVRGQNQKSSSSTELSIDSLLFSSSH